MSTIFQAKLLELADLVQEFPEIRYVGDPVLRTPTAEVDHHEGKKIGHMLAKTLGAYRAVTGVGRGLAAPQIGIAKSVFVTYHDGQFRTYINPRIINASKTTNFYRELCMSVGLMWGDVERPEWIEFEWTDEAGAPSQDRYEGVPARLIQHELAHLHGQLCIDIAEPGTLEICISDPLHEKLRKPG